MRLELTPDFIIDSSLLAETNRLSGLSEMRTGRHILRNAHRQKVGEVVVRRIWMAEFSTSADAVMCLSSFSTDFGVEVCLAFKQSIPEVQLWSKRLSFGTEWKDPMSSILQLLDIWSDDGSIPLMGWSYRLFVDSGRVRCHYSCCNPSTENQKQMETALLMIGNLFANGVVCDVVDSYLSRWLRSASTSAEH